MHMKGSNIVLHWAEAEREACKICADESVDPSHLLYLSRNILSSPEVPESLAGYCNLWLGRYGTPSQRSKHLTKAAKIWVSLAAKDRIEPHDEAWWNHCALVTRLYQDGDKYQVENCYLSSMIENAICSLKKALNYYKISNDVTALLTFGMFLAEFQALQHSYLSEAIISLREIPRSVAMKPSLRIELSATEYLVKGKEYLSKAKSLFSEAAFQHSLFMHIFRCKTLAGLIGDNQNH